MSTLTKCSIAHKALSVGTHRFDFKIGDRFFEAFEGSEIHRGKADVQVVLNKQSNLLTLDFRIEGEVCVTCDRCLEEFMMPVGYTGTLAVRYSETEQESDGEVMWIGPSETEIDLSQYIYESICLSLPYQRVHPVGSDGKSTREASFEELKHKAEWFLDTMSRMGVTTVEGKSGYGLDRDTELKQLSIMQAINECPDRKVDIATTFLGAHALPEEYKGRSDAYIDFLINEMLPMIHQKQLAENCDIFCEKGVFTVEQSRKLLKAAQALGFGTKLHADEIVSFGGAELAGELKALSADHLLQASDEGIKALAQNNVVATLLPLTAFTLKEPYARGRKMIDSGCAVALATDLNPGSCFSGSIPLTFALACIYMKLTVAEAITAITLNGAAALGRADRIGSIEAGKQGDFVLLGTDNPHILPYYTGMNAVKLTIKGGRILHSN